MILKELIKNVKFDDVWEVLYREYNLKPEAYEVYKQVMDELRSLEVPAYQSEFTLVVAKIENSFEPGTFIFDVFGMKKGDENRYALEMDPWENWMNFGVLNKSIEFYSAAGVIAHALYKMTFFGYSAEAVAKRVAEEKQILTECCEELESENTISIEELKADLGIKDKLTAEEKEKQKREYERICAENEKVYKNLLLSWKQ